MKQIIILGFMVLIASSCGNPHVSSVRGGLESTNAPISVPENDPACAPYETMNDAIFSFSSHGDAVNDVVPSDFRTISRCHPGSQDDFNQNQPGSTTVVRNGDSEVTHETEHSHPNEKVIYLDDIFTNHALPFEVQSPVMQNGVQGRDNGINTVSSDSAQHGFIWSFASPRKYWLAKLVSVPSNGNIRIFNCNRELIEERSLNYPNHENGQGELHYVGVISPRTNICHVSISARNVAVDDFIYGP